MNYINTYFTQKNIWITITRLCLNRCFCKKRTTKTCEDMNPLQNINILTKETQTIISYEDLLFQSNLLNNKRVADFDCENTKYDDINYKSVKPFIPQITNGKVINVYDGQSFSVASRLPYDNSPIYRFSIKLHGIISPEITTKYETEKKIAQLAKHALYELIYDKVVELIICGIDKYGRILAEVYLNNQHINYLMLLNGHSVHYGKQPIYSADEWDIV